MADETPKAAPEETDVPTAAAEAPSEAGDSAAPGAPVAPDPATPPEPPTPTAEDRGTFVRIGGEDAPPRRVWPAAFSGGVAATLVALAAIGGGAYLSRAYWEPHLDALVDSRVAGMKDGLKAATGEVQRLEEERARSTQELGELHRRMVDLEGSLAELRKSAATAGDRPVAAAPAQVVDELARRFGRIEAEVHADRATAREAAGRVGAEQARLAAALERAEGRLAAIEAAQAKRRAADVQARLMVVALGQLATAVSGPEPFETPFKTLAALAPRDDEIGAAVETLRPYAATGVPTLSDLRARFDAMAREAIQANAALRGQGWLDATLNRLMALVSVRTVGSGPARDPVDAALAAAETRLGGGDLKGAVEALERVQGAATPVLAPWLRDARARLAVERAAARLNVRATAALSEIEG